METKITKKSLSINVSDKIGNVSALFYLPANADSVMVLAHGAGAGMNNKFMEEVSLCLAGQGIAKVRFNFPYMENGKKMPDTKPICIAAIKAAVDKASKLCPKLPVYASGKSFGGRMSSTAASTGAIDSIKGIVFFGFPLHAPGRPSNDRAEHLYDVKAPMLFLQGTRDVLAELDLLKPVIKKLGKLAELFTIEGADHSFHAKKEFNLKDKEIIEMMCREVKRWMERS